MGMRKDFIVKKVEIKNRPELHVNTSSKHSSTSESVSSIEFPSQTLDEIDQVRLALLICPVVVFSTEFFLSSVIIRLG